MVKMENNTKEDSMTDHEHNLNILNIGEVNENRGNSKWTKNKSRVHERQQFMARNVSLLCPGGQLYTEIELGGDRKTIINGMREINSNITCIDKFSGRRPKPAKAYLLNLLDNIKSIVNP